jgi:glyceraldehyde 3-phosphate dehydrogenase
MAIRVGINGFGRIARVIIRAMQDHPEFDIRAINWRNADLDYLVYMLKYDTTFGRFPKSLDHDDTGVLIDGKHIDVYKFTDAQEIPWKAAGVDYVIDCTGAYTTTDKCLDHLKAGAKHVLISAPAKDKVTPTFVYGVNHMGYNSSMSVISNTSCTTNCLAPMLKVVEDNWGIKEGLMSTIHAATAKQKVVDAKSLKDWRTGRSVFGNIIPTTTGAAKAVGLVIPSLQGKMTGISYRVPTADVSIVDVNVVLEKPASHASLCEKIKLASETTLKGILEYVDDEVVSGDFVGDPCTSIFDARQTIELNDHFFKLVGYYDNEFGYCSNMLNMLNHMAEVDGNK